jgi:hypothetical protein
MLAVKHISAANVKSAPPDLGSSSWLSRMSAPSLLWRFLAIVAATIVSLITLLSTDINPSKGAVLLAAQVSFAVLAIVGWLKKPRTSN